MRGLPSDRNQLFLQKFIFTYTCLRLERPGTWLHGGSVGRDVGFLGMPQWPPEHGDVAGDLLSNRQGHASTPHALVTW